MRAHHPRVHFRGPRRYELSGILTNRKRKIVKRGQRRLLAIKIARRKGKKLPVKRTIRKRKKLSIRRTLRKRKMAPIKATRPVNGTALSAAIQKVMAMSSATLTQHLFKNLTFTGTAQQDAAKALFLSRLQAAHLKLSILRRSTKKRSRLAYSKSGSDRLALRVRRVANQKRRELGL